MEFVEEKVDITALLQGILNAYPGNSAILREYLQNSDDARAKKQTFILDERTYPTDTLCDQSLRGAQGPALLAFNDGVLSERDWEALMTIHSSSKKSDETQTGKNGLGFRASYHLTETPHVLSGGTLIILDPHRGLQHRNAGLKISIDEAGRRYPDQLKPFERVREIFAPFQDVSNSFSTEFPGTIFRLPLRTDIQAHHSRIKSSPTSVEEVRSLLQDFCQAGLAEVILFLKHITHVEVHRIDPSGHCTLFGRVSIENLSSDLETTYIRQTTFENVDGAVEKRRWYFRNLDISKKEAAEVISKRLGYDVGESLTVDKLFPSIELATPVDEDPITGSLFTLLPLPVKTYFPVHLNAVFALTPDRQSLKNIEEVGNVQSRERRLVEWNRIIFEVWAPAAWADLIELLPLRQSWSIWPPEEKSVYWMNLTTNLVQEVVLRHSPVFATIQKDTPSLISLEDANTLISPPETMVDLLLLAALGMKIVQPPRHIFSILTSGKVSVAARELSPSALHIILMQGYQRGAWQPYNRDTIGGIIDYLVFSTSPPSFSNLEGLPWFENSDGTIVTLQCSGVGGMYIVPESVEEARLFSSHPRMLAWSCLPEKLRIALLQSNSNTLDVAPLGAKDVLHVLTTRFTSCDDVVSGFEDSDIAWVLDFLSWLNLHQGLQCQLFDRNAALSSLFLLPTTTGLRRLSGKATFVSDSSVANAWEMLGVPRLRSKLSTNIVTLLSNHNFVEMPESCGFLPFVLDHSNPVLQSRMSVEDRQALRRSIYSVVVHRPFLPPLTQNQKGVLEQLPVFAVRQLTGGTILSAIRGIRLHVNVRDDFPLPLQKIPTIYLDVRNSETRAFIRLFESLDEKGTWDLLRIGVEHWSDQPADLQDRIIDHIFENWMSLPPSVLERLKKLPFVSVNGTTSRVPPANLIDPNSLITPLFEGEVGRIPSGRFSKQKYVTIMQDLGFLHSSIDSKIIQERLTYLSKNSSNDVNAFKKSTEFVRLLGRFWESSFFGYIHLHRDSSWMPGTNPSDLVTPKRSRDLYVGNHADPKLYDFELNIFPRDVVFISEPHFREALGWSCPVPSHVLLEQFRKTISLPHDEDRYRRLKILIEYMDQLLENGDFSSEAIESAREVVLNVPWIPVSATSVQTVETEYALFSGMDLQPPFRQVHLVGCRSFLLAMGCREQPTLDSMTRELQKYKSFSNSDIPAILALLEEISTYGPNSEPLTLVPGQNGQAYPVHDVYYPDTEYLLPSALQNKVPTHSCISRALSDRLGIRLLSSLVLDLGGDHFDEDEQMGVGLIDRIQGFLREYDIQYALNEFLANADDAGASTFSMMLDCRRLSFPQSGMISPSFHELQHHASIILFNDKKLTKDDFLGLRRVGRGGKVNDKDTHGRHGLGALSFYYFTDVVTVISGEYIMILDPSGSYLPRNVHGGKRTALIRTISNICSQYSNQLRPYDSLYGFSKDSAYYNGTLFCLPLNTKISAEQCDKECIRQLLDSRYRELAENAFFFTRLEKVRAEVLSDSSDRPSLIWSLSATRKLLSSLSDGLSYHLLEITGRQEYQFEEWMISTSAGNQIPDVHEATATGLKLTQSNLTVQLAIRLRPTIRFTSPSLFSTLRLPRTTLFPFHLNARFAISSNRQSIVFDSPDSQNARDPKTSYNAWILTDIVPSLYLDTLTLLIQKHVQNRILADRFVWLSKSKDGDDMYRHTADAFHSLLAKSDNPLFKAVDGSLLSFKNSVFLEHIHSKEILDVLISLVARGLVVDYSSSGIARLGTARTMAPPYVEGILRGTPLETIQKLYSEETIKLDHILKLLLYVSTEPNLVGLPLLVSSTSIPMSIPGMMDRCVYLSKNPAHAELFNIVPFVHSAFSNHDFDGIWSSGSVNVINITAKHVNQLIRNQLYHSDDDEKELWLKKFWKNYHTLPGPPSMSILEQQNFKLVRGSLYQYSLRECRPQQVVYFQDPDLRQLSPALLGLGIDFIPPTRNLVLKSYLDKSFPPLLVNILHCLADKNICDFRSLPAEEGERLTAWFQSSMMKSGKQTWHSLKPGIDRSHLSRLKIWPARTSQGEDLHSASDLGILPPSFDISALTPYLQNQPIASYSSTLCDVIRFCRNLSIGKKKKKYADITMSPESILDSVRLPSSVSDLSEVNDFKHFLLCVFPLFPPPGGMFLNVLPVLDSSGRLRPLNQLFDHTVPLFSISLAYTPASFIHPHLQDVDLHLLRRLGLQFQISFDSFRSCAMAVQTSLQGHSQDGSPTHDELMNMSREAFRCYNDRLPSLIMSNQSNWAVLNNIKFVRPKDGIRRQGASYLAADYYVGEQGRLLAPNHFVLPKLEPVAWTQRALFFDEPSEVLVVLNTKLGIPEVWEVVAHLKILTTEIAPNHPGNSTLLSDIKATYKWLNDHAVQAREHMLLLEGEKLFLNVDDPSEDCWVGNWVMAQEMVLNLHYDYGNMKRVKVFLQNYNSLLHASGCSTVSLFSRERREQVATDLSSRQSDIMKVFNEMRKGGEVVDMVLVPTFDSPMDVLNSLDEERMDVEQQEPEKLAVHDMSDLADSSSPAELEDTQEDVDPELRAHRIILAATIPFIRDWAEGWKHNKLGDLASVEFNGTSFGAQCILNFIYTGNFNYVTPPNCFEDMKNLLYELLALLPIADEWDMPDLREQVEWHIIYRHDLVQRLLPLHEKILKVAERYKANGLKKVLDELSEENQQLMRKLKDAVK